MSQASDNKRFMKVFGTDKFLLLAFILTFTTFRAMGEQPGAHSESAQSEHAEEQHEGGHGDSEGHAKEDLDVGTMIMHHITDAHEIHFMTLNAGSENEKHVSLRLPVILYGENGLEVFSASKFYHGEPIHLESGHGYRYGDYVMVDEVIYYAHGEHGVVLDEKGGVTNEKPLDLSITKTVVGLMLTTILVLLIFISAGRAYKRKGYKEAPSGIQSLLEPLIVFVHDQVIVPSVGSKEKAAKFAPFLLSVFFFIWIANLLGLMSFIGGYNVMGSLGVTLVLSFFVFVITNINGNKHYWKHIFWPDGVPLPIKFILVPIEALQIFMKPLVLMIRLTANITAGHIIILAFTALIFIFGQTSAVAGYGVGIGSVLFMVFMFLIELLVAFLQAYVFTLLSALYFGAAVEDAHH